MSWKWVKEEEGEGRVTKGRLLEMKKNGADCFLMDSVLGKGAVKELQLQE